MSEPSRQPMPELTWQAHPAAERSGSAALGGLAVVAFAAAVGYAFDHVAWGLLSLIVLIGALNRFYFPSRFVIDEEGITARYPLRTMRMRWAELRRFVHDRYGGYLSRRAVPSRLDAYGGMHLVLPTPVEEREAIIRRICERLPKGGRTCGG